MRQFAYSAALFISSACGLIVEIVAGRLLAPYVGMSLYTWTAIIAVVLAGFSIGHWVGGRLAGPAVGAPQGCRRIALALGMAALSSLGSLVLLRLTSGMLMASGMAPIPLIVSLSTVLFLLPSLFVGIVSPILTKIAVDDDPGQHGRVIGRMYALGTLGSIAGTLAAGYLFISWIGSTGTVIAVAATYGILALGFALADPLRGVLVAVLALGFGGLFSVGSDVRAFQSPCTVESDYFCIRIDDFTPQSGRPSTLMALDHLVHSINDRDDPGLFYSPYLHFVDEVATLRFARAYKPAGDRPAAFFIGGGGFTLPRAWAARYPGADLMVAELDPDVTRAAAGAMWLDPRAPGLDIRHRDARPLLQSLPAEPRFDVVFGDAFHDISIPAHLVTHEFHREIARRLTPGGFYILNAVDNGADPRFVLSLVKTLRRDFGVVEVWAENGELGAVGRVTFAVIASERPTGVDRVDSTTGIRRTWLRWPDRDLTARVAESGAVMLTDDYAPVDRLMAPLLLNETL